MNAPRIAVCDDEMLIRVWLEEHLTEAGYRVEAFALGGELVEAMTRNPADLILLDLRLPDGSGVEFLREIRALDHPPPVIMATAYGEVETAVEAVRSGAFHFLEKPVDLPQLLLLVDQALETQKLVAELHRYREGNRWQFSDVTLVGRSDSMRGVAETITQLGERGMPATVLISGESGTGKDVVARAIHARGPRRAAPFISVNCSAIPETLVESELFGHQAGAFTDARTQKQGLFELAHGGTLFLDEVGDMPVGAQATLLQVLETHQLRRVGGVRDIAVDVHVLAATNRDLEAAVADGSFRRDLFYRLNVIPVRIPPLRKRPEDIAPLAFHFLETLSRDLRLTSRDIDPEALAAMEVYDWPGNARQLRNVLERILLLHEGDTVRLEDLPAEMVGGGGSGSVVWTGGVRLPVEGLDLEILERELLRQALHRAEGNKSEAARLLGLSRDTLRYRIEKFGLEE
ncbi:MAG TPA: sigma-54 dependent transcriptional regulator [Longimicrobiales bacterium]|nr:sigma-54 dependent transcriptional regulator [Longimicrobiales bacterium]